MTVFGQIVLGPPGSGKTKYCTIMQEVMTNLGRKVFVVNLDPANDRLTYECALNVFELINIEDVMTNLGLGPNGALVYCIEFLEANIDWLLDGLARLAKDCQRPYFLFDLPGQVELYTHHAGMQAIVGKLVKADYRLASVNLVDSFYVSDAAKFVAVLMMSLSSMLRLELPHVNVLSKMDLIKQYGKLQFGIDFYTDVLELNYLCDALDQERFLSGKFKSLNRKICDVVQDFSLVSFQPLNIQKRASIIKCIQAVDRANGYLYGHLDDETLLSSFAGMGNSDENDDEMMFNDNDDDDDDDDSRFKPTNDDDFEINDDDY